MRKFWLVKETKNFTGIDDNGEQVRFPVWRENVIDVWAVDLQTAKVIAKLTGIEEGTQYNDIIEEWDL